MIQNVRWSSRNVPLFLSILVKFEFSRYISEKYQNIKFHDNPSSGTQLSRVDGRTNTKQLIVAFRNFWESAYKRRMNKSCIRQ
jgi:hypothetical protein